MSAVCSAVKMGALMAGQRVDLSALSRAGYSAGSSVVSTVADSAGSKAALKVSWLAEPRASAWAAQWALSKVYSWVDAKVVLTADP